MSNKAKQSRKNRKRHNAGSPSKPSITNQPINNKAADTAQVHIAIKDTQTPKATLDDGVNVVASKSKGKVAAFIAKRKRNARITKALNKPAKVPLVKEKKRKRKPIEVAIGLFMYILKKIFWLIIFTVILYLVAKGYGDRAIIGEKNQERLNTYKSILYSMQPATALISQKRDEVISEIVYAESDGQVTITEFVDIREAYISFENDVYRMSEIANDLASSKAEQEPPLDNSSTTDNE